MKSGINLEQHFVAYIDILGFSDMVNIDCNTTSVSTKNATVLHNIHEETRKAFEEKPTYNLIQFSDSIVIARPFAKDVFCEFLHDVAAYQCRLLTNKLLCRGGVAYGKHFYKRDFIFSQGLIEAYTLEKNYARYPRIIISNDLLDLLSDVNKKDWPLLKADDGWSFIDYIDANENQKIKGVLNDFNKKQNMENGSIREKIIWLMNYYDYIANSYGWEKLSPNKFSPFK